MSTSTHHHSTARCFQIEALPADHIHIRDRIPDLHTLYTLNQVVDRNLQQGAKVKSIDASAGI